MYDLIPNNIYETFEGVHVMSLSRKCETNIKIKLSTYVLNIQDK